MKTAKRGAALGLLAALLGAATPCAAAGPDGWVATLVWSPEYCNGNLSSKELQCHRPHGLVLDGLRAVFAGADAPCARDRLPPETEERWSVIVPNRDRLRRIWRNDGDCSSLGLDDYGVQLDRASRRLAVPEAWQQPVQRVETSPGEMKQALALLNPGLDASAIALQCSGRWLKQITLCLDADFSFRACSTHEPEHCPATVFLRPVTQRMRNGAS